MAIEIRWLGGLWSAADPQLGRSFLRQLQLGTTFGGVTFYRRGLDPFCQPESDDRLMRHEREVDRIRNDPTKILSERGW